MKEASFSEILNSPSYAQMRVIIQAEVNENRLERDYGCFKQNPWHKNKLKEEKLNYREQLKKAGIPKRQYKWKVLGTA